jgi:hypothetical protein
MSSNSVYTFIKALTNIVTFKTRFKRNDIGKTVQMHDGYKFTVFRHAIKNSKPATNPVVLCVRLHFTEKSTKPSMPMLSVLGFPGFREKYWMINHWNEDFQALYEWDTKEDAEEYVNSFAMNYLKKKSVPRSIHYEIIPGIGLADHMRHLDL